MCAIAWTFGLVVLWCLWSSIWTFCSYTHNHPIGNERLNAGSSGHCTVQTFCAGSVGCCCRSWRNDPCSWMVVEQTKASAEGQSVIRVSQKPVCIHYLIRTFLYMSCCYSWLLCCWRHIHHVQKITVNVGPNCTVCMYVCTCATSMQGYGLRSLDTASIVSLKQWLLSKLLSTLLRLT